MLFQLVHPEFQISGCFLSNNHLPSTYRHSCLETWFSRCFHFLEARKSKVPVYWVVLWLFQRPLGWRNYRAEAWRLEAASPLMQRRYTQGKLPGSCPLCSPPPQGAALGLSGNGGSLTMWPRAPFLFFWVSSQNTTIPSKGTAEKYRVDAYVGPRMGSWLRCLVLLWHLLGCRKRQDTPYLGQLQRLCQFWGTLALPSRQKVESLNI